MRRITYYRLASILPLVLPFLVDVAGRVSSQSFGLRLPRWFTDLSEVMLIGTAGLYPVYIGVALVFFWLARRSSPRTYYIAILWSPAIMALSFLIFVLINDLLEGHMTTIENTISFVSVSVGICHMYVVLVLAMLFLLQRVGLVESSQCDAPRQNSHDVPHD